MRDTQLRPAQVVRDRYRILERVGQGAAGAVYRVLDLLTNQHHALKHLLDTSIEGRAQFAREAGFLSRLSHPSLPRASDFFVEAGQSVLVMTFVHGPDLGHLLASRGRPFDLRSVLKWADDVLDALGYLHSRHLLHHDIKPRNVKLDAAGRAVLVDFGLAAATEEAALGYTATYAPLEQIRGQPTDPRSDLYALGATMYELLARCSPAPAFQRATLVDAGASDPLLPLETLPPLVEEVLNRALAVAPCDRFSSARDMQLALREAGRSCKGAQNDLRRIGHLPDVTADSVATIRLRSQRAAVLLKEKDRPSLCVGTGSGGPNFLG